MVSEKELELKKEHLKNIKDIEKRKEEYRRIQEEIERRTLKGKLKYRIKDGIKKTIHDFLKKKNVQKKI